MALVRIALLALQPDLNRDVGQVGGAQCDAVLGEVSLDRQDLRLAQGEIDVERIGLDDRRKLGRPGDADQRADIDEVIGDDAVERGEHLGVAEVDLGEPDGGLRVQDVGRRLVPLGLPLLRRRLAGEILPGERRLPVIFGLVVLLGRLVGGERRLLLVNLRLIDVALDAEQLGALLDRRAVDVID